MTIWILVAIIDEVGGENDESLAKGTIESIAELFEVEGRDRSGTEQECGKSEGLGSSQFEPGGVQSRNTVKLSWRGTPFTSLGE